MFGDLIQTSYQRHLVRAHGSYWMVCYVLSSTEPELKDGISLAIAAPSNEAGVLMIPCQLMLIKFTDDDLVVQDPRPRLEVVP